jgi:rfaE bifunctional protein nucleotidyltransferase chain/domain
MVKRGDMERIDIQKRLGSKVVFTNGCFDILSSTHVRYLNWCSQQGDFLIIGLNSDESIRKLKGESRPFNTLDDRIEVLEALAAVDYVIPFNSQRCNDLILKVKPDIYVKGGDYTVDSLDRSEYDALMKVGTDIRFAPNDNAKTTTDLITKIRNLIDANIL